MISNRGVVMRLTYGIVLLVGLLGCVSASSDDGWKARAGDAERFIAVAASGDTTLLFGLIADSGVLTTVRTISRLEPELLPAARAGFNVDGGFGDSLEAQVAIKFSYKGGTEVLMVRFIHAEGDRWLVRSLTFPERM